MLLRTGSAVLYLAVITLGLKFPLLGILVFGILGVMVLAGRRKKWCSSYCPRGSFLDLLISRISPRKPIPRWFFGKFSRYSALTIFIAIFLLQLWRGQFFFGWPDNGLIQLGKIFVRMCIISSGVAIPLALWKNQRTWCSLCPVGNLLRRI